MPTIDVCYNDLCSLIGKKIPLKELEERALLFAKAELESVDGDILKLDVKDTNRPDLWSAEGIAREIAGRYGKPGLPKYDVKKSNLKVIVEKKVENVRPLTACAVVRDLHIDENVLNQIIQLQEKICICFGRKRQQVAIGVYDLHRIQPPIRYTTVKPDGIKFIPLDFDQPLTPKEILKKHPKGKEYGHLLKDAKEYPIFIDAAGQVLSMPPIINSNYTGKVTENTRDVFIECSGFEFRFLEPALASMCAALADRGGKIESVLIDYGKAVVTPNLTPKKIELDINFAKKITGLDLSPQKICELLRQARYDAEQKNRIIELRYPAYRQDIMHQVDVVEDILISYDYNKIEPEFPKIYTRGSEIPLESFCSKLANVMIGLGYQEIASYILSSKKRQFQNMLIEGKCIEIANPISSNWSIFRTWLIPCLLEFLSHNKHVEYPQSIFEIGDVVLIDDKNETKSRDLRKIAAANSGPGVSYEHAASALSALLRSIGFEFKLIPTEHPSFIKGRVANVMAGEKIGIVGEIHPAVLEKWQLEQPVSVFELDVNLIQSYIHNK